MPHTINASSIAARRKPAGHKTLGPKGRVLEPYAKEVLLMAREGQSMRSIANWLAGPPRNVSITRQAVHAWVKRRINKLVKLNAVFLNTGVGGPFQEGVAVRDMQSPVRANGFDRPRPASIRPALASDSMAKTTVKRVDVSEFMVDESELSRAQNPLVRRP